MSRRRSAIYTRKSSEEGLDQTFNSLDAQREACEAYIASQAGEGWCLIKTRYDDGAYSGGTMERPALQRLLADIRSGRVDTVVVYKVDRLTRSLADFAKMVEVFDAHGVSFVSVTQQFNTTTSMGRLTLNMLLSFAQFEREVTGERIRDKIAASKRKGMWMGGVVPLGYEVRDRKLVINEPEAETVRTLFDLYLRQANARRVNEEADRRGLTTKARTRGNGWRRGGLPFTRGHIYKVLSNPIYAGDIAHKGERHAGEHAAIIDRTTWEAVQDLLKRNAVDRRAGANAATPSLLAGLLRDEAGNRLAPSHASKAGRRDRYYVSRATGTQERRLRLPAGAPRSRARRRGEFGDRIAQSAPTEQRQLLLNLLSHVEVGPDRIGITMCADVLRSMIEDDGSKLEHRTGAARDGTVVLELPVRLQRRGVGMKFVITDYRAHAPAPDRRLITAVAQAHSWFAAIRRGEARSITALAQRNGIDRTDIGRMLPLALLAPDIVEAIIDGRQPVELTAARVRRMRSIPVSWAEQRRVLGFV